MIHFVPTELLCPLFLFQSLATLSKIFTAYGSFLFCSSRNIPAGKWHLCGEIDSERTSAGMFTAYGSFLFCSSRNIPAGE